MVFFIAGATVLLILYALITFNSLTKLRNRAEEAFATMDVYLKKRWDLIPSLVETVKGYAGHETEILETVAELRSSAYQRLSTDGKIETNEKLGEAVFRLMAVAENYPDLKANQQFLELSTNLTKVEDDIANARKYYNAVIRNFNNKVQMFPSNLIAGLFGFSKQKMFEIESEERERVEVRL